MKRKTIAALIAVLTVGMSTSVWAAPSISQIIPEAPVVITGNLTGNQTLVVTNANTTAYKNTTVAEIVKKANDDNTITTVKEILAGLKVDTKTEEIKTTTGTTVNPTLYEQITPFVDLAIKENDKIIYETTGAIQATITVEAAKEMKKKDVLLMQIDPNSGKVYFVAPEKLDSKTGEITATFQTLGPVAVLKTVPVVVKDTDPEKYENEKVTEAITQFKDETKDVNLADVLNILTTEDTTAIQVADGVTINAADYSTAMGFADLAIKQGEDYLYDMDGSLEAEANRDLASTDWQKLVQSVNPDYDIAAAEADPSLLTELEPFTIPGSFLMQINPVTGEAEYIYEPELYFALPNSDEDEEETEDDEEEVRTSWTVEDETASEDTPNLVIRAEFKSMGPFAIFLPNDAQ
ncbi:hypothetical protein [Blautia glucerasea]|uniref:hypothetical protein n=1 Tax=Blautia glucerasea TaxID=536633 RepID=UPI00156D4817|nr:hypothetical protein [Blautia glucerasea]NSL02618.1 hypothetical protein [Blautia glucerasea]